VSVRLYWHDFETGRSGFTDKGDLPDGPLVEEIEAFDYFTRMGHVQVCGWPGVHHEAGPNVCQCGFLFPERATIPHFAPMSADDEALL